MTVQRQTGLIITIFTSAVVLNHLVHGELSAYDLIYSALIPFLAMTAIFESVASKLFHVVILASVGALMVYVGGDSIYLGVVIMAVTYLRAFTYGFLNTWARTKVVTMSAIFGLIIFFSTGFDPVRTALWMMMGSVILWFFWSDLRVLVAKARVADEAEKKNLEQRLVNSEALLEETVEAGMVLVKEIKSKDAEHECKE